MNQRPTFLTVLCVLTFIYSGFGFLKGFYDYAMAPIAIEMTEEVFEEVDEQMAKESVDEETADFMENVFESSANIVEHARPLAVINILVSLLSLLGAFFMWRLQKTGFYLYLLGQLGLVFSPLIFVDLNWLSGTMLLVNGVFALAFIIMYGLNLKHMRQIDYSESSNL